MKAGLTIGSTKKKLTAQTPTSTASVNGYGLTDRARFAESTRQVRASTTPSVTASVI